MEDPKIAFMCIKILRHMVWISRQTWIFCYPMQCKTVTAVFIFSLSSMTVLKKLSGIEASLLIYCMWSSEHTLPSLILTTSLWKKNPTYRLLNAYCILQNTKHWVCIMIPMLWMRKWKPRQVTETTHNHTTRKQQNCNLSTIKSVSKNLDGLTSLTLRFSNIFISQLRKLKPAVFNTCIKSY